MRSSLRRLRGFALHRSEPKEKREFRPPAKLDELNEAAPDIQDLRSCYDGLLSAAAATANSVYEFSEALHEMGTCLLHKTALNDDEDTGGVSLMLGKTQFELQRLVDNYRTHIIQTITTPSECLLKELQIVEDMKQQCDDKRDLYNFMLTASRQKGRSRNGRGDPFTPQQLKAAREDHEEEANLFIFRLKSLKQGQSRSLFTQVARHHAAQKTILAFGRCWETCCGENCFLEAKSETNAPLDPKGPFGIIFLNFFRKGLKALELIEPRVKSVAEQQHIDYHFSELEEDDDMDCDTDGGSRCDSSDDGKLSFDYGLNERVDDDLSMHINSIVIDRVDNTTTKASSLGILQENVPRMQAELLYSDQRPTLGTQSAPIFANRNLNFSEKSKRMPPPSTTRKFHTYVLPTPVDIKNSAPTGNLPTQISYSSPLNPRKLTEYGGKNSQSPTRSPEGQTTPNLSSENLYSHQFTSFPIPEAKKIRRYAFSGPIAGKSWSSKPFVASSGFPKVGDPTSHSKLSPTSVLVRSTIRISELHELPRPPSSSAQAVSPPSALVGHSAPLVSKAQETRMARKGFPLASETASPLPTPPAVIRSFSIPYRGRRTPFGMLDKAIEAPRIINLDEHVHSPPLTPLSLKVFHDESASSVILQC